MTGAISLSCSNYARAVPCAQHRVERRDPLRLLSEAASSTAECYNVPHVRRLAPPLPSLCCGFVFCVLNASCRLRVALHVYCTHPIVSSLHLGRFFPAARTEYLHPSILYRALPSSRLSRILTRTRTATATSSYPVKFQPGQRVALAPLARRDRPCAVSPWGAVLALCVTLFPHGTLYRARLVFRPLILVATSFQAVRRHDADLADASMWARWSWQERTNDETRK
ncbi:hypothetical protein MSAN_02103800 [Mycena sanguinolenta]|uniref:Uncharacterized protein n=1 Tax=Mycena sanguinolenta TaxID=230812 RepID=A0A8H6XHG4_9AGAR|nr:hypothetical protein MSAN_02103800 [Mycena sanguinolenta]